MANASVTRIGQINAAGDVDALFLKVFAGEVLTAFDEANVMLGRTYVRSISSGKSAQFPATGKVGGEYHVPGTEITGLSLNAAETVITIDDLLISHGFIANIDEAKTHYDYRSIYSTEMGRFLARTMDKHLLQVGVLAARATNVVSGEPGGSVVLTNDPQAPGSANFATNGDHLAQALFIAAQKLDEKDVPAEDRVCFVRPAQYYNLVKATNNLNKDWGGMGSYAEGSVLRIAGIEIVKTNHLPNTDLSAATGVTAGTGNKYRGNFANTSALVLHKSAIGTVKLLDMGMESAYDIRRQGTLMVAKYAVGHGILRPQAAVEIRNAAV
jgi:hypothetical protein